MNKKQVIDMLQRILGLFRVHERLLSEIVELVSTKGNESQFFSLLVARLRALSAMGINAVKLKEFEPIRNGINSMHMQGKNFNIRILYAFLTNGDPVLLLAFYEREGKKKTDYSPYIEPAIGRFKKMKEAFENEPYEI